MWRPAALAAFVILLAPLASAANVYATLVYNDDPGYVAGACVLAQTLIETQTAVPLVALVTEHTPPRARRRLVAAGWGLVDVAPLVDPQMPAKHRWYYVMSKLELWLLPYARVVYIDADAIVIGNSTLDLLFACPHAFCAVAESFPPDDFNSGVMVLTPSDATYAELLALIGTMPPHSYSDQALLNRYFNFSTLPAAARLHSAYNVQQPQYSDYRAHLHGVRVLHYTGFIKPWRWWASLLAATAAPWLEARERFAVRCSVSNATDAVGDACDDVRGSIAAALVLYSAFSLLASAVLASVLAACVLGLALAVAAAVAVPTPLVAAYAVLVVAVVLIMHMHTVRVLRVVIVALAAPAAFVTVNTALPADANTVTAVAAAYALYAALVLAALSGRVSFAARARPGRRDPGCFAGHWIAALVLAALPIAIVIAIAAFARWMDRAAMDAAGLTTLLVAISLATATIAALCAAAWAETKRPHAEKTQTARAFDFTRREDD